VPFVGLARGHGNLEPAHEVQPGYLGFLFRLDTSD
jgi:hypothetical protein